MSRCPRCGAIVKPPYKSHKRPVICVNALKKQREMRAVLVVKAMNCLDLKYSGVPEAVILLRSINDT